MSQNHHVRSALWILAVPLGRREAARARDDGGEDRVPRAVLESRI